MCVNGPHTPSSCTERSRTIVNRLSVHSVHNTCARTHREHRVLSYTHTHKYTRIYTAFIVNRWGSKGANIEYPQLHRALSLSHTHTHTLPFTLVLSTAASSPSPLRQNARTSVRFHCVVFVIVVIVRCPFLVHHNIQLALGIIFVRKF